ncbi:hypothetical protein ACIPW5_31955 [Streptomyces sp. NPDC090077]|uniref:hypothetical protein n=1 Tax=Streptomyces sp. NPDC090077 TaxID=3365938 RepID=UPI00381C0888
METGTMAEARRWLAEQGVVETPGGWTDPDHPGRLLTASDVAHTWAALALTEDDLDDTAQAELALALVDLLDEYWVTCELHFTFHGTLYGGPRPKAPLWKGYRTRLERERNPKPVRYSLWVDWFENRATSAEAFAEVLGNDIEAIAASPTPATLRRASRVLADSGPVPWETKHPAYLTAHRLPALHEPLFKALLAGYHDAYGDLHPAQALTLLDSLTLPPTTEHLPRLRTVLTAGHANHYRSPEAWDAASDAPR